MSAAPFARIPVHRRHGRCYELSAKYVTMHDEHATLVHGTIFNRHRAALDDGPPTAHAWVELQDGRIFDPVDDFWVTPEEYESYRAPEPLARYTREEAARLIGSTRSWGPWDEATTQAQENIDAWISNLRGMPGDKNGGR